MDFYNSDKYRKIGESMMSGFGKPKSCAGDSCNSPEKTIGDLGMFNFGGIVSQNDSDSLKALGDRMLGKKQKGQ